MRVLPVLCDETPTRQKKYAYVTVLLASISFDQQYTRVCALLNVQLEREQHNANKS